MIVNQRISRIFTMLIALFLVFSIVSPVSVFAAWNESGGTSNIERVSFGGSLDETEVGSAVAQANKDAGQTKDDTQMENQQFLFVKVKGVPTELVKVEDGYIEIDKKVWSAAKSSDVSKVMQRFVDAISAGGASDDAVQGFMTEFQDADQSISSIMLTMSFSNTQADMYQAYKIMKPFLDVLNIVLGVGCVLLILLLFFSTVMDLAYIGLPVWREAQAGKEGGKNPFGVSYEALTTVKEVEKGLGGGDGGYRNAYLLYFKRRALTYIILALCIMYLICGGISGIISFVLSLVGGFTG